MKKILRKAMTVVGSAALVGMTVGSALAASYPTPFTSNSAVVYGAGAASSDNIAATNIATALDSLSESSTTTTVEGGEVFSLFDSDNLYFGDAMNAVMSSALDDNDMDALADGDYDSGSIDTEYSQTVTLGSTALSLIVDDDLDEDETPTIGYKFDDDLVLNYTLSFDDTVTYSDMPETDMPLFGGDYYVLDATTTKITLLNSAEKTVLSEGETVTVDGHTVSIDWIDSAHDVKFNVDGEITDKLDDGEYYELDDGSYIVLSEGLYTEKDGASSKAEFSLGSGKVVLEEGQEVEVNDDAIDGMTATLITNGTAGHFDSVSVAWTTDGEVFLTEGDTIEMPVFGAFSLVFNGVDFGETTEDISVESGDTLVLSMGNYDVDLLFNSSSEEYAGGDGAELVTITASQSYSSEFAIAKDQRFLATVLDADVGDVETAYYEVQSVNNDTAEFDLALEDLIGTDDVDFVDASSGDDEDLSDAINLKVVAVYDSGDTVSSAINTSYSDGVYINATSGKALQDFALLNISSDSTIHWDIVVSEEGMIVEIPVNDADTIDFYEADDDGDLDTGFAGTPFKMDIQYDSDDGYYAEYESGVTMVDDTDEDKTVGYVADVHASKVMFDSDAHTADVEYYADEVIVDLAFVAGGDVSTSTSEAGIMAVTDAEAASMTSKNLVVVGGSAINSVAASLLGGEYRGEEFTAMTGVAAGQFLIASYDWGSSSTALLVAGYEAEDTTKAATALLASEDLDVTVGKKYVSSTDTVSETDLVAVE